MRISPVWLVLASIASVQVGSAIGKSLYSTTTPLGVVWLRLVAAAVVLLIIARPRLRGRSAHDWRIATFFGLALVVMNTVIYQAFARIPIGVAVTIEFLGPLAVAVAGSRRVRDLVWVTLAGLGVALLGLAKVELDWWGVLLAALAGACWAGYIVFGEKMGRSWRVIDALALGCAGGAMLLAVPTMIDAGESVFTPRALILGAGVGLLSTVIPYTLELNALKRIPKPVFSILLSLEPAAAALAGFVLLREKLTSLQMMAMACVIVASIGATRSARPRVPAPD